jgi:hypothetical protein
MKKEFLSCLFFLCCILHPHNVLPMEDIVAPSTNGARYLPSKISLLFSNSKKKIIDIPNQIKSISSFTDILRLAKLQNKILIFCMERTKSDAPRDPHVTWQELANENCLSKDEKEIIQILATLFHNINYVKTATVLFKKFSTHKYPQVPPSLIQSIGKTVFAIRPTLADQLPFYFSMYEDQDIVDNLQNNNPSILGPALEENFSRLFFLLSLIPEHKKPHIQNKRIISQVLGHLTFYHKKPKDIPSIEPSTTNDTDNTDNTEEDLTSITPPPSTETIANTSNKKMIGPVEDTVVQEEDTNQTNELYFSHDLDPLIIYNLLKKQKRSSSLCPSLRSEKIITWEMLSKKFNLLTEVNFDREKAHDFIWGKRPETYSLNSLFESESESESESEEEEKKEKDTQNLKNQLPFDANNNSFEPISMNKIQVTQSINENKLPSYINQKPEDIKLPVIKSNNINIKDYNNNQQNNSFPAFHEITLPEIKNTSINTMSFKQVTKQDDFGNNNS